jgi:hypothetical protein
LKVKKNLQRVKKSVSLISSANHNNQILNDMKVIKIFSGNKGVAKFITNPECSDLNTLTAVSKELSRQGIDILSVDIDSILWHMAIDNVSFLTYSPKIWGTPKKLSFKIS